jgi:N-acetylmuramidase-like protein
LVARQETRPTRWPHAAPRRSHRAGSQQTTMTDIQRTLTADDFARAAKELNVEVAEIRAVAEVEAAGAGFLDNGDPAILYEAHIFHRATGGRHASALDRRGRRLSSAKWDRSLYGATGAAQHKRYEDARALNPDAANRACSWGTFQILGDNYKACGFDSSQAFVDAMYSGAPAHLDAFVAFLKANKLDAPLRAKDWKAFARGYNGPAYAANKYDQKMAAAYARWKAK